MQEDFTRLLTEGRNPRTEQIDQLDSLGIVRLLNAEDKLVAEAVEQVLPQVAAAVDWVVAALSKGGRLFYAGAGTSGRLGVLDAAECVPTFGVSPLVVQALIAGGEGAMVQPVEGAEDSPDLGASDVAARGVGPGDVFVGIAASGRTPYTIGCLKAAKAAGAKTVAVINNPGAAMAEVADLTIAPVTGPEAIMGSTRLKAGTAQKFVLNLLSTAAFIQLGKVYSNLMVDVLPSNAKLVERAKRIISLATGCTPEEAAAAYTEAGAPKPAIVMVLAGIGAEAAKELLHQTGGRVRQAIELAH